MKILLVLFVAACTGIAWVSLGHIGYSFRGPGYDPKSGVTAELAGVVVVAVTDGEIEPGKRSAFFKALRGVLDAIPESEGLIGYAVRKQFIGDRVWTISAWKSHEALGRFVRSKAHRQAAREGGIPPGTVRSVTLEMEAGELPISWRRVRAILDSGGE